MLFLKLIIWGVEILWICDVEFDDELDELDELGEFDEGFDLFLFFVGVVGLVDEFVVGFLILVEIIIELVIFVGS